MAKWRVIKMEWGLYCSDFPPFDSFDEACRVCKEHTHSGVVLESTFKTLEALPQEPPYDWEKDPCRLKNEPSK